MPPARKTFAAAVAVVVGLTMAPAASAAVSAIGFERWISADPAGIWAMPASGGEPTRLVAAPATSLPDFAPDGSRLLYSAPSTFFQAGGLVVSNIDGTGATPVHNTPSQVEGRTDFGPGNQIAFAQTGGTGSPAPIRVVNADGTGAHTVYAEDGWVVGSPAFSPTGAQLVFMRREGGAPSDDGLWIIDADGSDLTQLTTDGADFDLNPAWSPDGSRIAFTRLTFGGGGSDIFVVNPNGSGLANRTNTPGVSEDFPVFSPDSSQLAFETRAAGQSYIETINVDGSNRVNLTGAVPGDEYTPTWANVAALPSPPGSSDTTPPKAKIKKGPKEETQKRKAKFRFTSDEPGSTFECKLDRKRFKPCSSPTRYEDLEVRKHKFKVRATDAAGNTGPTDVHKWEVVEPGG